MKHCTELFNHLFLGWGYSSTGSIVDSCVLGDGSWKVLHSSPGEDTYNFNFYLNCVLSYMEPNNIFSIG